MRMSKSDRMFNLVNLIVLIVIGIIVILPLYYLLVVSFTDSAEYYAKQGFIIFPTKFSLAAYEYILSDSAFIRSMGVTVFITVVGTILSLIASTAFAYALSRKRLPGRRIMQFVLLITLLFSPGLIPDYMVVRSLGLINSVWALILPTLTDAWYIMLIKNFFDSMPDELEESARLDGCTDVGIFFRIMLPLSKAALAAFGLFYAVGYWNTFFKANMYITAPDKWPFQVLLRNMILDSGSGTGMDTAGVMIPAQTVKMAAVILSIIPILLVYPALQKHFDKGVMVGAVKG